MDKFSNYRKFHFLNLKNPSQGDARAARKEIKLRAAARDFAEAKSYSIADAHCDTISKIFNNGEELYQNSGHIDIKRLIENNVGLQFFAVWIEPSLDRPFNRACEMIKMYHEQAAKNMDVVTKVRSKWDYDEDKLNSVLTLEGGQVLEGSIENLETFYSMGARLLTLTWNGENEIGFGALTVDGQPSEGGGLKAFGIEVVRRMEELGMMIDVSHLSEDGFWDVVRHTKKSTPIFATHSNCKAICDHPRNLTDEQIKLIIERKGFIGLNLYPDFLGGNDIELIVAHAKHIIALGGEDVLGFGFDFDGVDKLPEGINGIENAHLIIEKLSEHFDEPLLRKICGENLISKIK